MQTNAWKGFLSKRKNEKISIRPPEKRDNSYATNEFSEFMETSYRDILKVLRHLGANAVEKSAQTPRFRRIRNPFSFHGICDDCFKRFVPFH